MPAWLTNRRALVIGGVVAVVALIAVVAMTRIGTKSGAASPTSTTSATTGAPSTTSTTGATAVFFPLTGLPVADGGAQNRAALVVKIDNADGTGSGNQARPQAGINQADVVYEEMV